MHTLSQQSFSLLWLVSVRPTGGGGGGGGVVEEIGYRSMLIYQHDHGSVDLELDLD